MASWWALSVMSRSCGGGREPPGDAVDRQCVPTGVPKEITGVVEVLEQLCAAGRSVRRCVGARAA